MTEKEITDYIFISDEDLSGDLAFVFGTWHAYKEACQKAAELYKKKFVNKILVTGGLNPASGKIEAELMKDELVFLGVKSKDVLVEGKATNTLENVTLSANVIDSVLGLDNIKTVVAVVKSVHSRRALMTLKKNIPNHIKIKSAPYDSVYYEKIKKDNWFKSEEGKSLVLDELKKIKEYLQKGDLAEI